MLNESQQFNQQKWYESAVVQRILFPILIIGVPIMVCVLLGHFGLVK